MAKLFGARSHRPFIPALGVAVFVGSFYAGRTQSEMLSQRWMLDAYGFMVMAWVLPLHLLGVSLLRGQGTRSPALRRRHRQSPAGGVPPMVADPSGAQTAGVHGSEAEGLQ